MEHDSFTVHNHVEKFFLCSDLSVTIVLGTYPRKPFYVEGWEYVETKYESCSCFMETFVLVALVTY